MCPSVSSTIKSGKEEEDNEEDRGPDDESDGDDGTDDDGGSDKSKKFKQFYQILMGHIYCRKSLPSMVVGRHTENVEKKIVARVKDVEKKAEDVEMEARCEVEADLDNLYIRFNYDKHVQDCERAREEEYNRVTNSLLNMVGGTIGERKRDDQKVANAIGNAKLVSENGPPSLDRSFQDFFV
ncbi:hypothetical protein FBU30_007072 [Linnemannia zychae]|nr:hypothetical protein FBU30_007072 [Linnemannia zychae]